MNKKTFDKQEVVAFKELQEEESQPLFTEAQRNAFQSGYVEGMGEALSLFDENRNVTDHLKPRDKK